MLAREARAKVGNPDKRGPVRKQWHPWHKSIPNLMSSLLLPTMELFRFLIE
jgi:hypothetical protein